jgi:hypothetical protein
MASPVVDDRASATAGTIWTALGQIMSALDDRDPLRALRVLAPKPNASSLDSDQETGPRCTRCATRGE